MGLKKGWHDGVRQGLVLPSPRTPKHRPHRRVMFYTECGSRVYVGSKECCLTVGDEIQNRWQRRPGIVGRGRDGRDHHGVLDSRPAGADPRPGRQGGSPSAGAPRATRGDDSEADSRRQSRSMEGSALITLATARPGADIAAEAVDKGRRGGVRRSR